MYCHDLEVMSLNPDRVEVGAFSRPTSVYLVLDPKIIITLVGYEGEVLLVLESLYIYVLVHRVITMSIY